MVHSNNGILVGRNASHRSWLKVELGFSWDWIVGIVVCFRLESFVFCTSLSYISKGLIKDNTLACEKYTSIHRPSASSMTFEECKIIFWKIISLWKRNNKKKNLFLYSEYICVFLMREHLEILWKSYHFVKINVISSMNDRTHKTSRKGYRRKNVSARGNVDFNFPHWRTYVNIYFLFSSGIFHRPFPNDESVQTLAYGVAMFFT